jgi:ribosomal protein S18 acetylase RimI-like enzyme
MAHLLLKTEIELNKFLTFLDANKEKIIGKFAFNKNFDKEEIFKALSENLEKISQEKSEDIIQSYLLNEDQLIGAGFLVWSKWDSAHFNLKIGKINQCFFSSKSDLNARIILLKNLMQESKKKNFDLVFVRVPMDDISTVIALEKVGAILTDVLMTLQKDLDDFSDPNIKIDGVDVREASKEDVRSLCEIGRKAFKFDHFHSDPTLSTHLCDELYVEWIKNSLHGLADEVLVAKRNQKVAGFITCKIESLTQKGKFGFIDLIGVEAGEGGKGIGSLLVNKALNWFIKFVPSVYVGTQVTNTSAVRLYTRLGFKPVYSEATMHLWISR